MAVYSTAVSPLYFTDEQTETIKPALTCRGSPYSTISSDIQTDPIIQKRVISEAVPAVVLIAIIGSSGFAERSTPS